MSIFFKLHITDDDPRLTDRATLGAHRVGPGAVALDLVGATVLALHGRHLAQQSRVLSHKNVCHFHQEESQDRFDPRSVFLKQEFCMSLTHELLIVLQCRAVYFVSFTSRPLHIHTPKLC